MADGTEKLMVVANQTLLERTLRYFQDVKEAVAHELGFRNRNNSSYAPSGGTNYFLATASLGVVIAFYFALSGYLNWKKKKTLR